MSRAAVDPFPAIWTAALRRALAQSDDELRVQALRVISGRNVDTFDGELVSLAGSNIEPERIRREAFAAVAPRLPAIDDRLFSLVNAQLADPDVSVIDKLRCVAALARAKLSEPQLFHLATAFESAGPAVVPALLAVYDRPSSERVGTALLTALQSARDVVPLNAADLQRVIANYPPGVQQQGAVLIELIGTESGRSAARLDQLTATISGGDTEHGRELFNGKQAACAACHRVNGAGALVGPDLSKISASRQPRDLLESILYPSASFARGYEPYTVLLNDGRVISGIIARETAHDIVVRTNDLSEIRISRDSIDAIQPSQTSIMPQGLDGRMTEAELRDLVAYLRSLK
jgi:putative heme-binding domain-containing protein